MNSAENRKKTDMIYEELQNILDSEMVPALGCTDPIGIAFCAAVARKYSKGNIVKLNVWLSKKLIKNVMSVTIPDSRGMCGAGIVAALGAVCGNPEKKLELLENISEKKVDEAIGLEHSGKIEIYVADTDLPLYMKMHLSTEHDEVQIVIRDSYTNVTEIRVNGHDTLTETGGGEDCGCRLRYDLLNIESIVDFADNASLDHMEVVKKGIEMNRLLAETGMNEKMGTCAGNIIMDVSGNTGRTDIVRSAMAWAASGVDARMSGCSLPAMSNTGSGNQGIVSTMPVFGAAKVLGSSYEKMIRAAALSCLITIYIKNRIGRLSAICGCTIAGTGSACGMAYLRGGRERDMLNVMKNMFGNVAGLVCDGAKISCALKTATCINAACLAADLAMRGFGLDVTNGIVGEDEKQCIDNFVRASKEGLSSMDDVILDMIMNK